MVAASALAALALAAPVAAPPHLVEFSASALNDSVDRSGDVIEVRSDTHAVRSITLAYTGGVTGRGLSRGVKAMAFTLLTGDQSLNRVTGHLVVESDEGGVVTLTSPELASLHASFRPGARPRLRLAGLPAQTHSVELITVGTARDMLRDTGRCSHKLRRDSDAFSVRLDDQTRRAHHSDAVSCAHLPPNG